MYLWIWRHLPVSHPAAKAGVCAALVLVAAAVLWYWVFPWLEPMIQFDQSTVNGG